MADSLDKQVDDLPTDHTATEPAPHLDMHRLDGQVYTVLKNRIERAIDAQKEWVKKGILMREFMRGEQWAADLQAVINVKNGWIRKTVNKMKSLRTGIISQVAYQNPKVTALALRRTAETIGKATVESTLINLAIHECDFQSQQKKAAFDATCFGAGALQLCTNPEKAGLPQVKHRRMEDVVVDPDANCLEDAKWIAYRRNVNIFEARREFDDDSLVSDQRRASEAGITPEGIAPAPEDETIEIWEVWCRADAIGFMDADESSARNKAKDKLGVDAPQFNRYLSEEGNRVFQISLNHNKVLSDEPWPFILDNDMLPIWLVYLEEKEDGILPESVLQPAMGLQRALNTVFTCIATQAYTQARIKYAADKQTLQDETVSKGLKSAEVGTILPTDGGTLGISKVDFGNLNIAVIQLLKETDNFFNQITGYNEMFGGMQGTRSAAEAVIREDRAQTNSSSMRQSFETGLKRVVRGMSQIAKSTMSEKRVADLVGREEMGYINPETGEVDDNDKLNTLCINWPYDDEKRTKPEDIRRENFIELVVNSTRRSNPQQEAQDLRALIQDVIGLIGTYTQQGYRINTVTMARKLNYIFSRVLQAMGIADYKQMEIRPEDLSIDDRLMPRGQTEEQMFNKFKQKQAQETEQTNIANADAVAEAIAQQLGVPIEVAQTLMAGLTPEMVTSLVQEIESGGTMQGAPAMPMPGAVPM